MAHKFPLGIQTFNEIIEGGYVYVDKTESIYDLAHGGKYFFLSRPRRFGKSLMLSTLEAYFGGRRELFKGLAIDRLESQWDTFPVLRIDLNNVDYTQDVASLHDTLAWNLRRWENEYNLKPNETVLGKWFGAVIEQIYYSTGRQVVILVDEYDKPLVANVERDKCDLQERMRNTLKAFYGNVKTMDPYIKFAMFTGVSRFSHVSIFSDLNNLIDISLDNRFSDICGISDDELHRYFDDDVALLAQHFGISKERAYAELKRRYDGYRFSGNGQEMYNPWSLFSALSSKKLSSYWYSSGTPTFLIKLLRDRQLDLTSFDCHVESDGEGLLTNENNDNVIAVLFQTGYLTIKDYDDWNDIYSLGIPNGEVMQAFNSNLMLHYSNIDRLENTSLRLKIFKAAQAGDVDALLTTLKGILAEAPVESSDDRVIELNYRNIIAIALRMSGLDVHIEQPTSAGRIDLALEADSYVYVMEFKRTTLAAAALQLESRHYADRYLNDQRQVKKIAVALDDTIKNIASWQVID